MTRNETERVLDSSVKPIQISRRLPVSIGRPVIDKERRRTYLTWNHAVSETSDVSFPRELDLMDGEGSLRFISDFILEEASLYDNFYGVIVFGSISRNQATNASDIDIVYVFQRYDAIEIYIRNSNFNRVQKSITRTLRQLYDVHVHDQGSLGYHVLSLHDLEHCEAELVLGHLPMLDRDSRIIVKDPTIEDLIKSKLRLSKRRPHAKIRKQPPPSHLLHPHGLNLDTFYKTPWQSCRKNKDGPKDSFYL